MYAAFVNLYIELCLRVEAVLCSVACFMPCDMLGIIYIIGCPILPANIILCKYGTNYIYARL